jgi:hypothetical protein
MFIRTVEAYDHPHNRHRTPDGVQRTLLCGGYKHLTPHGVRQPRFLER